MESKISIGETAYYGTVDNNLRYVGPSPNNYVKFNGDERWIIIGVFHDDVKGDQIKIIRNDFYLINSSTDIQWDSNGSNNWATATLNTSLNNINDKTSYISSIKENDPTSYNYIDINHVWNIGGAPSDSNERTRQKMYDYERCETAAGASGAKPTWEGAIGLMYPSDYGYSTSSTSTNCDLTMYNWNSYSECYSNAWLLDENNWQWTITPYSDQTNQVFFIVTSGPVFYDVVGHGMVVTDKYTVKPVLYLNANVKIVGGLGTSDQPYELGV